MILLDTHIWIWWVSESPGLSSDLRVYLETHTNEGLGVSVISCWEVAKLVERGRLELSVAVGEWIDRACSYPGVELLGLTAEIAVLSTQLPGEFHRDPADQMIVATARMYDLPLVTVDTRIRKYPHVKAAPSDNKR
jgi:PIN domain nuclease of toxin-antitoxin system